VPRISRKSLGTSFFHIIVQGINKEYIFNTKENIEKYLSLLIKSNCDFESLQLIAYCIMNNHAHMLIYSESILELSKYMKIINTKYAKYYNKKNQRVGYVFRDRYVSEPIFNQRHLLACIRYVHRNPVVAKIVQEENEYLYSSYNDYINSSGIVNDSTLKLVFGSSVNYIQQFLTISTPEKNIFLDLIKEKQSLEIILKSYCKKAEMNLKDIANNKGDLIKLLKYLVIDLKIPKKTVSEILNVNRTKIIRLLN